MAEVEHGVTDLDQLEDQGIEEEPQMQGPIDTGDDDAYESDVDDGPSDAEEAEVQQAIEDGLFTEEAAKFWRENGGDSPEKRAETFWNLLKQSQKAAEYEQRLQQIEYEKQQSQGRQQDIDPDQRWALYENHYVDNLKNRFGKMDPNDGEALYKAIVGTAMEIAYNASQEVATHHLGPVTEKIQNWEQAGQLRANQQRAYQIFGEDPGALDLARRGYTPEEIHYFRQALGGPAQQPYQQQAPQQPQQTRPVRQQPQQMMSPGGGAQRQGAAKQSRKDENKWARNEAKRILSLVG